MDGDVAREGINAVAYFCSPELRIQLPEAPWIPRECREKLEYGGQDVRNFCPLRYLTRNLFKDANRAVVPNEGIDAVTHFPRIARGVPKPKQRICCIG